MICRHPAARAPWRSCLGPSTHRAPSLALDSGHEPFGHVEHDEHEDEPEEHHPAGDVRADDVLEQHDDGGAHDRTEDGSGAARDYHEEYFRRIREREDVRADELIVVRIEDARDRAPESSDDEGDEADAPDVPPERLHPAGLIPHALQTGAEGGAD